MFLKAHCRTLDLPCYPCLTQNCMSLDVCICTCHRKCGCSMCKFRLARNRYPEYRLHRQGSLLSTTSTGPPSSIGSLRKGTSTSGHYYPSHLFRRVKRFSSAVVRSIWHPPRA
ncbi:hypothetical protein H4R33_001241 [Dimargaris cristalligena]|nr:hypothetical protein H4R33_001241 [Dimargaris cristalligena]